MDYIPASCFVIVVSEKWLSVNVDLLKCHLTEWIENMCFWLLKMIMVVFINYSRTPFVCAVHIFFLLFNIVCKYCQDTEVAFKRLLYHWVKNCYLMISVIKSPQYLMNKFKFKSSAVCVNKYTGLRSKEFVLNCFHFFFLFCTNTTEQNSHCSFCCPTFCVLVDAADFFF